ncbi:hypothetical protein CC86DRAFT_370636, partial [Ophiobolus disseminans]
MAFLSLPVELRDMILENVLRSRPCSITAPIKIPESAATTLLHPPELPLYKAFSAQGLLFTSRQLRYETLECIRRFKLSHSLKVTVTGNTLQPEWLCCLFRARKIIDTIDVWFHFEWPLKESFMERLAVFGGRLKHPRLTHHPSPFPPFIRQPLPEILRFVVETCFTDPYNAPAVRIHTFRMHLVLPAPLASLLRSKNGKLLDSELLCIFGTTWEVWKHFEDVERWISSEGLDASDFNLLFRCVAKLVMETSMIRGKRNAASRIFVKFIGVIEVEATISTSRVDDRSLSQDEVP